MLYGLSHLLNSSPSLFPLPSLPHFPPLKPQEDKSYSVINYAATLYPDQLLQRKDKIKVIIVFPNIY